MEFYQAGRDARTEGKPRDANPNQPGSPWHKLWDEGWTDTDRMLRDLASCGFA